MCLLLLDFSLSVWKVCLIPITLWRCTGRRFQPFFLSSIFSPLGRSCKSLDFAWMSIIKETFKNVNNFDCNADECCPESWPTQYTWPIGITGLESPDPRLSMHLDYCNGQRRSNWKVKVDLVLLLGQFPCEKVKSYYRNKGEIEITTVHIIDPLLS